MPEGTSSVAAAILAAEAARQKYELRGDKQGGFDISANLLSYYRHFLKEIGSKEPSA